MPNYSLKSAKFMLFCGLSLLSISTYAEPIGNLKSLKAAESELQITTDQQVSVKLSLITPQVFRLEAHAVGVSPEANNTAAPIVLEQPQQQLNFLLEEQADFYLLKTQSYVVKINKSPLLFSLYQRDAKQLIWREIQPINLTATTATQTLSSDPQEQFFGGGQQNGQFAFKGQSLEISYSGGWEEGDRPSPAPFFMSNRGYGVVRNTWSNGSYDFRADDYSSLSHQFGYFDAYYLVDKDVPKVLDAYTALTGRARLLPRWAFEYGDADCYNDADNSRKPGTVPTGWHDGPTGTPPDVIESVAKKYREHDMPGGWILPNDGYGCGYTKLPEVVAGLAKYGFKTGLWTENGVDKIAWEVGTAGTRAQKLDVAWTGQGYQFAMNANAAAAAGIWQNSPARPFIWTVMGWAGIQRYAVTWTGDQSGSWDYIRWHIPTLIGSGLSGQAYATGDVDGIFGGSPETFTRDLQWKSFTPVLMGMSGWSKATRKHPWWFDEPYRSINRKYLKLKMRLMPYMYTLAYQTEQTGAPMVRGLMWDYPNDPNATKYPDQFWLGRDLLIAPIYRSMAASKGWRQNIYLPKGQWHDYWDGRVINAPSSGVTIDTQVDLETTPVFVRAGAIIPMYPSVLFDGEKPKDHITFDIYPSGDTEFTWYEDDGQSRAYQTGAFSQQRIAVKAPTNSAGAITIELQPVEGSYQSQETTRSYEFWVHSRAKPIQVMQDGQPLNELKNAKEFASSTNGWFFDTAQYGVVRIKTASQSIRQASSLNLDIDKTAELTATSGYGKAPALGDAIAADSLLVLGRPAEEPGHPLENAFDDNPDTWFRTKRDQSLKTGAHEFVIALGERRMVAGFELAPRNDKHWQAGQVRDVEVYLADNNGEWGPAIYRGRLAMSQHNQQIKFKARPGSLFRFRVLSTQDQAEDSNLQDPMVTANNGKTRAQAFNALIPKQVNPISISEFKILTQPLPTTPRQQLFLAEVQPILAENGKAAFKRNLANTGYAMQMNGLQFSKGLGVGATSQLDYALTGNWQLFRADLGIDDSCKAAGSVQFQIYGDGKLLFDSGTLEAPAVVKPELDIRDIRRLSLRTVAGSAGICANWANASLIGFAGDKAGQPIETAN